MAAQKKAREDYISNHKSHEVPLGQNSIRCDICDNDINTDDVVYTIGIKNDTIYYATINTGDLDLSYVELHESKYQKHFILTITSCIITKFTKIVLLMIPSTTKICLYRRL